MRCSAMIPYKSVLKVYIILYLTGVSDRTDGSYFVDGEMSTITIKI